MMEEEENYSVLLNYHFIARDEFGENYGKEKITSFNIPYNKMRGYAALGILKKNFGEKYVHSLLNKRIKIFTEKVNAYLFGGYEPLLKIKY
jgi:hypothetical protein